jgi:hypothetical protein
MEHSLPGNSRPNDGLPLRMMLIYVIQLDPPFVGCMNTVESPLSCLAIHFRPSIRHSHTDLPDHRTAYQIRCLVPAFAGAG